METNIQFIKEQKKPEHANYKKVCLYCGREFECVRIDAKYCTSLCRVMHNKGVKRPQIKTEAPAAPAKEKKPAAPKQVYKNYEFEACLSCQPEDEKYKEFKNYLKAEFGCQKKEMLSLKAIKILCEEWNSKHRQKITLKSMQLGRKDGFPMTKIVFFVK